MGGPGFQCGMCEKTFPTKVALHQHMLHHRKLEATWDCEVCHQTYEDRLSLEQHKIASGHKPAKVFGCGVCSMQFPTQAALEEHKRFPSTCSDAFRAPQTKKSRSKEVSADSPAPFAFASPTYDYEAPPVGSRFERPPSISTVRPATENCTQTSMGDVLCNVCGRSFQSQGRYARHFLGCKPQNPATTTVREEDMQGGAVQPVSGTQESSRPETLKDGPNTDGREIAPVATNADGQGNAPTHISLPRHTERGGQARPKPAQSLPIPAVMPQQSRTSQASATPFIAAVTARQSVDPSQGRIEPKQKATTKPQVKPTNTFAELPYRCTFAACRKGFRSEAALKQHQFDSHRVETATLNHAVREQLKNSGLLRASPLPTAGRQVNMNPTSLRPSPHVVHASNRPNPPPAVVPATIKQAPEQAVVVGPEDFHQTSKVSELIVRLVLQDDVLLHHGGKIIYGGVDWKRVPVAKQGALLDMFEEQQLCHLPKSLQHEEYIPAPAVFKDEYQYFYPVADFQTSPDPSLTRPCPSIISLTCIKVGLTNGGHGAVKVAAVDVATCRILLNHLIWIESQGVRDWRTTVTGLKGMEDLEEARKDGYKVFKGWEAARSAIWKFIDSDTIIIGHNLRADIDALRMIHGRAVDVAILAEKAANGPVSKQQLSLDALSRDLLKINLSTHPRFGRDALQNAFAIRELALWKLKNDDKWTKWAKEKSLDYQRIGKFASRAV